ncbi:Sphingosine Kinase [Phytophthora palmivora]|uniref:Sphingosine Kinase n=1 Tax=Phytophthora palmivora TaxID=4796 RepID=A0A2P4XKY9_9STRA|nr:Sphingosine Kinase [Phytophthora palmivora]
MAPGRQEPRAWRKENDADNRRMSVTSSEDVPVPGSKVPFDELLARELRKSSGNEAKSTTNTNGKSSKKPFLKRGARGWWMRQPDAKQKVVKHTLVSKGDENEAADKRLPSILSPPVSPIRRIEHNNQIDSDDHDVQRRQKNDEFGAWKNASFRSTVSTDIMGMKNVRQSYEAKQEREAKEIAEFEAIERDLAAEKEAYLMEKQQQHQYEASSRDQIYDNQEDTNHWGLPYSSFVSELHEQEQSRWQIPKSGSIFDDSLDEGADSALVFDNQSTLSKDEWMTERDGITNQLRDHFGYGNHYEKLYELEEEVKFYKAETLLLQKRKDYYDQEVKKLAIERDEFARYQQEQRVIIEKEWEQERAKMKKEEKLQERQWKLRMNATISHQDRKDRGEVEMLKAQIVKMQLDEKARASKWKAENDNLRQRVGDLEKKNQELCDEIKFLERDRLEQWEKYERVLKEKQVASGSASKFGATASAVLSEKNDLRTMDDVIAIKGTADELLERWKFPTDDESSSTDEKEDLAHSEYHRRVQPNPVDDYNSKRYSLDHDDSGIFADEINSAQTNADAFNSDENRVQPNSSNATYEWALPDAGSDVSHSFDYASKTTGDDERDSAISESTSALLGHKSVTHEVEHPGGKKEILYTDGSRKIVFPDGNEKEIDANGHVVIKFTNGDHKEIFPDTGITVYYYNEAQTKLTTYPDNRKVYEFPNQQIEMSLPDGTTEIQFADGIKKTIRPNGDEFSVFPDGTTMLEQPDGLREVTLLNQKKIRYFPDGQMACVTPSGQETRVRSDSELKLLMENSQSVSNHEVIRNSGQMEAYLRKHWPEGSVSVSCRVYASQRRADEHKRLQLSKKGIELRSVGPTASETDVIPWSWILGASESTSGIRRRFIPVYEGSEYGEEKEFVVFGCAPKPEDAGSGGLLGGLASLATAVLPTALTASKPGVERTLLQWVFKCDDENGDVVAMKTVKAIKFLADPRVEQSVKTAEKLLDPYGSMPPRRFMVVINPAGGKGNAQQTFEKEVAPVFEQANVEVETIITRQAGHATEILADVPLKKYDCIVAVGGDGLLSERLMKRKDWQQAILQPLGIIPGGSGNGLSASLLSRAGERFEAINAAYSLAKGQVQELDLFTATNGDGKVMHGFLSLEWAFIADMDIKSERYRVFGDMRFFIATALQIFGFGQTNFPGQLRYLVSKDDEQQPAKYHDTFSDAETTSKPTCVCLDKDGEESEKWQEMDGPFYMFWSMNVSHAAADAHIAPPADISDGYFHMMLVSGESYSRLGLAKLMMGIEDGSHIDVDRVQLIRTRAFTVRASNANDLMCVDGELFPGPEVKIELHRALGRVLTLPRKNKE